MPFVFKAWEDPKNIKSYNNKIKCPLCQLNMAEIGNICDDCCKKNQLRLIKNNFALINYFYYNRKITLLLEQTHFYYDGVDSVKKLDWQFFYQFDELIRKITKFKKKNDLTFFPINLIIAFYSIKKHKIKLDNNDIDLLISTCVSDDKNNISTNKSE